MCVCTPLPPNSILLSPTPPQKKPHFLLDFFSSLKHTFSVSEIIAMVP